MTEVCSLSSGLYEIAKMSVTTKDDSGRTLLRTWRQVKKISTEFMWENASLSHRYDVLNFDPRRLVADFALSSDDLP